MSEPTDTPPQTVNMVSPHGETFAIPVAEVDAARMAQFRPETPEDQVARVAKGVHEQRYGGVGGAVRAGVAGAANALTLGGFSALADDDMRRDIRGLREANPGASMVGEVGGSALAALASGGSSLAATPAGLAARAGRAVTSLGEGAGIVGRIGTAAAGGALEGALYGIGSGVTELALSDDPLTMERVGSTLSSHALFGAATGGVAGGVGKGVELGLAKARGMVAEGMAGRRAAASIPEDLAALDAKGLRAAREVEVEAIEAARVPQRKQLADDLAAFRAETREQKIWMATEDIADREIRVIRKQSMNADKQIDRVLDNPKYLADNPIAAKAALQKQEHALEQLVARREQIAAHAAAAGETGATRAGALDAAEVALGRNRQLQATLGDLTAPGTSPRLSAIADAKDTLSTRAAEAAHRSFPEQMLSGIAFGKTAAAVGAIGVAVGGDTPLAGAIGLMAPVVGAKASKFVGEKVFGRMAGASTAASKRVAAGVDAFLDTSGKAMRAAPVLATKVLSAVRYAPEEHAAPRERAPAPAAAKAPTKLVDTYMARAAEIRSQMTTAPNGQPVMRPDARAQIAARLAPVAALAPMLADKLETVAARRLEFLASKLPRRPDIAGMLLGPDTWRPSDMEMRTFARFAAAVEDPHAIVERLAAGTVTPEDGEAMKAVYPELMADITQQIVKRLPELQKQLPYARRLSLSLFSGVAVDPALDPKILDLLQAQYVAEEGTEQGTQAPVAAPQFGSVRSADKHTPAQQRQMQREGA